MSHGLKEASMKQLSVEKNSDVWVHLKINEGRNFPDSSSRLELSVRFMGWEQREVSSVQQGSRPKWTLNTSINPPSFTFDKFLTRIKDNNLVVRIQEVVGEGSSSQGIAFIPLNAFYSALESGEERLLADNYPYPIIGYNGWIIVRDPLVQESSLGEINVQLTAGSKKQIDNFIKFYGYDSSKESHQQPLSQSPAQEEEKKDGDFLLNVSVIEGRNLPYLKDRQNPNPNSYVSFENKFYSSVQYDSRTPLWNLCVRGLPLNPDKRYLIIRVWHSNSNTADEVLGFAAVDLFPTGEDFKSIGGWHNVMDFSGRLKGQIRVEISLYPSDDSLVHTIKKPESKALTDNFISNLRILEELSSNLKARLKLNSELNKVCYLDFDSLKPKDGVEYDIPDLGDIDWDEVMKVDKAGEESRRTADGQSAIDDQIKDVVDLVDD